MGSSSRRHELIGICERVFDGQDGRPQLRCCDRCGWPLPLNAHGNCRYHSTCKKKLLNERSLMWDKNNPEKKLERDGRWRRNNRETTRKRNRKWRESHPHYFRDYIRGNPEKKREYYLTDRKNNIGNILERNRRWASENPNYWKDYYKDNIDAIRKRNREYSKSHADEIRVYVRQWRKDNPDKVRAMRLRRRSREVNAEQKSFPAEWMSILVSAQDSLCVGCWREFGPGLNPTLDHIIPLSKGGAHAPVNTQVLCRSCNSSKHARLDWIPLSYRDLKYP